MLPLMQEVLFAGAFKIQETGQCLLKGRYSCQKCFHNCLTLIYERRQGKFNCIFAV